MSLDPSIPQAVVDALNAEAAALAALSTANLDVQGKTSAVAAAQSSLNAATATATTASQSAATAYTQLQDALAAWANAAPPPVPPPAHGQRPFVGTAPVYAQPHR
jgi:leucyl aminopeptidase (aminopeptidase T)